MTAIDDGDKDSAKALAAGVGCAGQYESKKHARAALPRPGFTSLWPLKWDTLKEQNAPLPTW